MICFGPLTEESQLGHERIELPNPWRAKSKGKIVRHVPLVLYSDDASGNVSKKWNQHMSFYCTLAGLPPKLANQDVNILFLATSNTAGALELADGLVDEFKYVLTVSAWCKAYWIL